MLRIRDFDWYYWLLGAAFLTSGIAGWHWGYCLAGSLAVVHVIHFAIRKPSPRASGLYMRMAYLIAVAAAIWEPLRWLYVPLTLATWTMVLYGILPKRLHGLFALPSRRKNPLTSERS